MLLRALIASFRRGSVLFLLASVAHVPLAQAGEPRDFNGDGKSDITWTNGATGEKLMWFMNGGGILGGGIVLVDSNWTIQHYGDFNGDGKTDLIWRNTGTGETVMWLLDGSTITSAVTLLNDPNWSVVLVGDFNGNGKSDLLWRNSTTGEVVLWTMSGTTIVSGGTAPYVGPRWTPTLVLDVDGDGRDDFLATDDTGATALFFSESFGFFGQVMANGSDHVVATHVGDFRGDGRQGVVWRNTLTGATELTLAASAPNIGLDFPMTPVMADPNWEVAGVDDFNGAGKADLLWRNITTGETALWLMNGTTLVNGAGLLGPSWQITRMGDFNGDGKADILFTNPVTHDKVMWLMDGLSPSSGYLLSSDPNWSILP